MPRYVGRSLELIAAGLIGATFASVVAIAWTGAASAPPNGNVAAPINVGTTNQVKDGGLALNALAVFGNALLSGTSRHLNFGIATGESGYGIRDNAGTMQFKNSGGNWSNLTSSLPIPPTCSGTSRALQWNGTNWSCTTVISECRVCIRQYGNSNTDAPMQCSSWASASTGEQATAVSQWAAGTRFANQAWIQCR